MSLKTFGQVSDHDDHVEFSFLETNRWTVPADLKSSARTANTPFDTTALLLGDETAGPLVLFLSVHPGFNPPDAPAHGHASDNFRMSALGVLPMGPESYGAGEFRFQRGWKPYPSDNYAHGPDGGWTVLCFGDRRGVKTRYVSPKAPTHAAGDAKLAEWLGIKGDLNSDDLADTAGPSALITNVADFKKPFLNGSYSASKEWPQIDPYTNSAGALMGHQEHGPVLILSSTVAGAQAASQFTVDTEVFHFVSRGGCTIGGVEQKAGDMWVQRSGRPMGPIVAGDDGVEELVVLGDRRYAMPASTPALQGWPATLTPLITELSRSLHA